MTYMAILYIRRGMETRDDAEMGMTQWYWRVSHRKNFKLGKNVEIGSFAMIDARHGMVIEDDVKIGFGCAILSYSSIDKKGGQIVLRKACKLGAHSIVMPGIEIGQNAVIGSNSVVTHNIPPDEVWMGSPARFAGKVLETDRQ